MRDLKVESLAIFAAAAALAFAAVPSVANASDDWGINGTFTATSNGEWSRQNEVFRVEASLTSTWTITTTCSSSVSCSGTVHSDLGWTAPIFTRTGTWFVKHVVPGWEPCADGSAADGLQVFHFYRAGADLNPDPNSNTLIGEDITTGPSGACGKSRSLEIRMPFKLTLKG